jgi:hypothetical protein
MSKNRRAKTKGKGRPSAKNGGTELRKLKELIVQVAQQARKTELHSRALVDVLPTTRIAQSSDQASCSCCCC